MREAKTPTVEVKEVKPKQDYDFKVTITARKYISPERVQAILEHYFPEVEVEDC